MRKPAKNRIGEKFGHLIIQSARILFTNKNGNTMPGYECLCTLCGTVKLYDAGSIGQYLIGRYQRSKVPACQKCSQKLRRSKQNKVD